MRTHRFLATGLFVIFGAAGTTHGQTGIVGGQARSMATGAPISGGVVQVLTSDGGRLGATLTDQSGRFRMADVPIGTHTVEISMTGHATWRSEGVAVRPGEVTTWQAELASQLSVSNLYDSDYRSFVGVPAIGRIALLRLKHEF